MEATPIVAVNADAAATGNVPKHIESQKTELNECVCITCDAEWSKKTKGE